MNDITREFAKQAGFYKYGDDFEDIIEKFAELIVRKCISLCQECIDDGCVEAVEPMVRIKEHFGVE